MHEALHKMLSIYYVIYKNRNEKFKIYSLNNDSYTL